MVYKERGKKRSAMNLMLGKGRRRQGGHPLPGKRKEAGRCPKKGREARFVCLGGRSQKKGKMTKRKGKGEFL